MAAPEPREPPSLRNAIWSVALVWLLCCVSAVVALARGNLSALISTVLAAACAAGWLLALLQWHAWRNVAVRAMAQLPWVIDDRSEQ